MSEASKTDLQMTRAVAERINRGIKHKKATSFMKIAGITLTEAQANLLFTISIYIVLAVSITIAVVTELYVLPAMLMLMSVASLFSAIIAYSEKGDIGLIKHKIFPEDVFAIGGNKFKKPYYVKVMDCDYDKHVCLVQSVFLDVKTGEFILDDNDIEPKIMSSEEILKGELMGDRKGRIFS